MAIYVPNAKGYFPDVEPFTPDYKFLSDILDKRADKYETNYKALNNVYSQIVYSDLGREDTNEARSQFVNQLQPTIEKISGLDLSLAQNVSSAKAVFQPFYDNDLIVADMVQTKNINDIRKRANSYRTSSKQEIRDKYFDQGLQFAEYQYQDFLNASQEDALREPMARYIENPQLYKRALNYLNEKGYKIKLAPKFTNDGAYQILTTNGEDVTDRFLSEIREMFGNDPLVQDAYYADAYVQARTHADNGMQSGIFSNVTEGMMDWNKDIIESSRDKIALQYHNIEKDIEVLAARKSKYDKYLKEHSFVPGSKDDIEYKNIVNALDGKTAQLEQLNTSINEATTLLNSNDAQMINNRGFNILFQSNIEHDLFKAADQYSFVTKEVEMKVDDLYKEKYKFDLSTKLEGYKSKLRQNEEILKSNLRIAEKKAEKELEGADVSFFQGLNRTTLPSGVVGLDKNGEPTTEPDKVHKLNTQNKKILELGNQINTKAADAIISITKSLNSESSNPLSILENEFTSSKTGLSFSTMSENQIKQALLSPENAVKLMPYLEQLKKGLQKDLTSTENVQLMQEWDRVFTDLEQYNQTIESYEKIKAENFLTAEKSIPELKKMIEDGIPSILQKDGNGKPMMIIDNFEEYEKLLLKDPDYVPNYQTRGRNYVLNKEILDRAKKGQALPNDFIVQKKVKDNDGNISVTNMFNPKYFRYQERTKRGGVTFAGVFSVQEAEMRNVQETEDLLKNIATMRGEDYNTLNKNIQFNNKERRDFDKQMEILEMTFNDTGAGDSGLYTKFDVNANLEGYETTGDLITETGAVYDLRAFGEKESPATKMALKQQYQSLVTAMNNPSAEFEVADVDKGAETPSEIKSIIREALSTVSALQSQKEAKKVATIEYYPNMVRNAETGNKAGYIIRFADMKDPTTKDNYSFSQREFKFTIPTSEDTNPKKTEAFENYYVASSLRANPQEKFTWEPYDYAKIDVSLNSRGQVEYVTHAPYYNAETGNIESVKLPVKYISYDDFELNDDYFFDQRKKIYEVINRVYNTKETTEKEQSQKNKNQ